jgi:hypothetical protein
MIAINKLLHPLVFAGIIFLLNVISVFGEGTKQLEPTNPLTTANRRTRIMFDVNAAQHRTPFATIGCMERYRLNVYINDPATEQIYFGFNDGANSLFYQVRDPDGAVVTGFSLGAVPATGAGFISTWDQAYVGPKIGTLNPTGYDPKILTPTKVGNYYFEFAPYQTGGTFAGDDMLYFDISVVRNSNAVVNGRVWSKAWQLSDDASGDIIKSYPAKFYVYTDDGIVSQLNINEWNGGTYTIYCNKWGVSNTNNWAVDRMSSSSWPGSDLPQYKVFLNNPDAVIFPTGEFGHVCEVISQSNCDGSINVLTKVNKPGTLTLNIDVAPIGSGPEDAVVSGPVTGNTNCDTWDTLTWNGLDGNGNPVVGGTTIDIDIDFLNGLTNLPLWDVEDNASGMIVNIVRPLPSFSAKLPVFWDDSNLPGGTVNDVSGCIYPVSGTVTGCHSWTSQNENMINTWWYFSDGSSSVTATVIRNPIPDFTFTNNCSGAPTHFTDITNVPGGYPIAWHWDFGLFGDTSNLQNPIYTFTTGGNKSIHLKVTSNSGCAGHLTRMIEMNTAPIPNAGNDQSIPYGTFTTLQGSASGGSGNYSYHWEPASLLVDPDVSNPVTLTMSETTDFTLTVTDLSGTCYNIDVVTITVFGGPLAVQLSANPMAVCKGGTTNINAQVGGGSGNYTYNWSSSPSGFTSTLEDITVQPDVQTTYTLVASDGFSNLTKSITISINPDPVVEAGSPQSIPNGTYTLLSGTAISNAQPVSYLWTPSNMVANATNPTTNTVLLTSTNSYTLTVADANGCVASDEIIISVTGGPLDVDPRAVDNTLCVGESTVLHALPSGGSGDYSISWTAPGGYTSSLSDPVVSPAQTTIYHVLLDDGFTQVEDDVLVTVNPLPVLNLIPSGAHVLDGDTILVCVFDTISIDAYCPNGKYLWSNGDTTAVIESATTGMAFDMLSYSVKVTNTLTDCFNTASITIMFTFGECSYGVPETQYPSVFVYPNPGKGVYFCKLLSGIEVTDLVVYNMQGKELPFSKETTIEENRCLIKVDIMKEPAGVYILKLFSPGGYRIFRLIKY